MANKYVLRTTVIILLITVTFIVFMILISNKQHIVRYKTIFSLRTFEETIINCPNASLDMGTEIADVETSTKHMQDDELRGNQSYSESKKYNSRHIDDIPSGKTAAKFYTVSTKLTNFQYLVPNIVHFVWFSADSRDLYFVEMVSVQSASKHQRPEQIMFHCNILPSGLLWDELQKKVNITIMRRDIPQRVAETKLASKIHATEVAKLDVLIYYGGIVLDLDVIFIQNIDNLRVYNFTMGKNKALTLNPSTIISSRFSPFLQRYYAGYIHNYKSDTEDYNSAVYPYELSKRFSALIHIEAEKLTTPGWIHRDFLFKMTNQVPALQTWRELYTVHLMFDKSDYRTYTAEYIKESKTFVSMILRYIYYGSPDEISPYSPWILYANKTQLA